MVFHPEKLQTKALTTGGYLKTPAALPAMGRCLAHVQLGELLSAKPNKQQPLELSTLWAQPDASSWAMTGHRASDGLCG